MLRYLQKILSKYIDCIQYCVAVNFIFPKVCSDNIASALAENAVIKYRDKKEIRRILEEKYARRVTEEPNKENNIERISESYICHIWFSCQNCFACVRLRFPDIQKINGPIQTERQCSDGPTCDLLVPSKGAASMRKNRNKGTVIENKERFRLRGPLRSLDDLTNVLTKQQQKLLTLSGIGSSTSI
ncbi:uncharacterized protein LOC143204497 [Rhynchophorus ferrugineus]|uniref:uncharacterized protein LOC143204497 n=1 Tax=Rhynchophorus ferrugineus TaxID=354439 RepID=UPI003FCD09CF